MDSTEKKTTTQKSTKTTQSSNLISAYATEEGKVVISQKGEQESDADIFARQVDSLTRMLRSVEDISARAKAEDQILKATHEFQDNPENAIKTLSNSTIRTAATLKQQEVDFEKEKRKRLERIIVLVLAVIMIGVVGTLSFYMDETTEIPVIGLPLPIVLWSFIGGVGATLYAFVGSQEALETTPLRIDWLIGRPIVGVIMGSVVYLAIVATTETVIGGDIDAATSVASKSQKPYLLWALAFIGGFSDKFAILLFDNLVGKYTSGSKKSGSTSNNTVEGKSNTQPQTNNQDTPEKGADQQ